jgi:hypothetical protein
MVAAKLANLPQRRPPLKSPIGDFFEGPRPGSVSQADAAALLSRSPTTVSLESAAMTLAGLLFSCWPNGFREGLDIQGQAIADRDRRINQRIGNEARKNERRNNREDFDSALSCVLRFILGARRSSPPAGPCIIRMAAAR